MVGIIIILLLFVVEIIYIYTWLFIKYFDLSFEIRLLRIK